MPFKPVPVKQSRYIQSYLFQNSLHTGTLWAALSLQFQKMTGLCGSLGEVEINLSEKNWKLYEEVLQSVGFKNYMNQINNPPNKKRRK